MHPPALPVGLYGMVDTAFGRASAIAEALLAAGCLVLQLRAKEESTAARTRLARSLLLQTRPRGALLVINDDLEAAAASGADGLHLGQSDGALAEARARLGPAALLGRSTHDLEQVRQLEPAADYIGFGPVFSTATKDTGYRGRGLALLRSAIAESPVPVVAIGGIQAESLPALRAAGARHWAVISAVLGGGAAVDWTRRAREFRE